jgi:hypothetical protein
LPRSSEPLTTRQGDHGSAEPEARGTVKTDSVDEDHVIAELRKELDLLIPDESEDDTTEDLPTGLRTTTEPQGLSDEEILASFSLDSIMSDAGLNFDDLPSVAPETKPAHDAVPEKHVGPATSKSTESTDSTVRDRTISRAGRPVPKPLPKPPPTSTKPSGSGR